MPALVAFAMHMCASAKATAATHCAGRRLTIDTRALKECASSDCEDCVVTYSAHCARRGCDRSVHARGAAEEIG